MKNQKLTTRESLQPDVELSMVPTHELEKIWAEGTRGLKDKFYEEALRSLQRSNETMLERELTIELLEIELYTK